MSETSEIYLIVGLGNIGEEYNRTRHNIGFSVVDAIAAEYGVKFKKKTKLKGYLAQIIVEGKKIFLLKPTTYMNNSGISLRSSVDFFKLKKLSNLLVVIDDIAIPFGEFKLKSEGRCGGHKGLNSIENHLGSNIYPRLRIGIGDAKSGDLVSHVLGNFNEAEKIMLPEIIIKAMKIIHLWLLQGIVVAMNQANIRNKENQK